MSAQFAAIRAESPNTTKQTYANNPLVGAIFDAYIADRSSALAYKRCKHPRALVISLMKARELWGKMPIDEFRVGSKPRVKAAVQSWLAPSPESGQKAVSLGTVRKRCTIMRAAFSFAVSEELIERGQEPVFELPPNPPPRERYVDQKEELPRLLKELDRAPFHLRLAGLLMFITGQRIGAILALEWEHVDFDKRIIFFRDTEAAADRSKKRRVNQPMDDELFEILTQAKERATCARVVEWNGRGCKTVFPGFKRLLRRAGLGDVRLHDLRRSSATYVHAGTGGSDEAAASHIGDSVEMARKVYIQEDPKVRLPGIEASSKALREARKAG